MRGIVALVLIVGTYINWTWAVTVPNCLTSGSGTPGYGASAKSLEDDGGGVGCRSTTVTREQVRQQAFEEWAQESEQLARAREGWYTRGR
jgi:hypothetical protein